MTTSPADADLELRQAVLHEKLFEDWHLDHQALAAKEGWSIFECRGSSGPYQVQRIDSPDEGEGELPDDEAAWLIVRTGTGEHHSAARKLISIINPQEGEAIEKYVKEVGW